ncbi:hypothetical protein CSHISOI_03341 [Colletotrichum shisoi]|uniref:Clr5 domain-containing protein n=1 Tax=Colletotrichum shisoi TaxID=2078593 RepID=A0A5Q4BYK0_9PEZI|nr:hypothetical protein CSHISOI_03341 [Colletotrichum shisoi]
MTKAWREKRAYITRLYIHENRTLNQVKAIMEEDHDFKASTRSYRQQFDKWGLAKYNCKKRTARRRSQDSGDHQQHQHHSTAGGGSGGGGVGEDMESDLYAMDPEICGHPMSPQSVGSSSLGSESAVDGGMVDMMDLSGATADSHAHRAPYTAGSWTQPQLPYMEQADRQQHQSVSYPQYPQHPQQQQIQRQQQQQQQQQRRRPSWDQQVTAQSPYGTLPSPPADLHGGDFSYYAAIFPDEDSGTSPHAVPHPDLRRQNSYAHQRPGPLHHQLQYQRAHVYSSERAPAPMMPERRESVPYYGGVACGVRQRGQQ